MKHSAILFVFLLAVVSNALSAQSAPHQIAIGDKVPDFTVIDLDGKSRKLSEMLATEKTPVMLTFWCSFCDSCRGVEGRLDELAKEVKGRAVVAAIDASAGETPKKVAAFAKQQGLTLPIFLDAPARAAHLFGTRVTTTTVVIDPQGILRYRGMFGREGQFPAIEAVKAVIAGKEVTEKETRQFG